MGTNYYLNINTCPHCGKPEDRLHIGKSSYGWKFLFMAHAGYWTNFTELKNYIKSNPTTIVNEYGEAISTKDFFALVKEKDSGRIGELGELREGYCFSDRGFS